MSERAHGATPHVVQVVQAIDGGGLETMAVDLAIALHEQGVRSSVLALTAGGRLEDRLRAAGVELHVLGGARYLSPRSNLTVARALRRLRPTVLHTHHLPSLLNTAPYAKLVRGLRVIHTEHAHIYLDEQPRMRPLLRAAATLADAVVLVGHALRRYYVDVVGLREDKIRVVVNGVDTDRFAPVAPDSVRAERRAAGLPDAPTLVGAVGRLAAVKNFELLIQAVAQSRAGGADVALALVGDGEDREHLEQFTRAAGMQQHVTFLGWRTDVARLVPLLDVLAVSSTSEALPLVVLEAMSAAVPVVSTAVGEIPQVVGADAGLLVPSGDVHAFAAALTRMAADPGTRRATGAAGRGRVIAEYSQRAMVDRYRALYGLPASR